MAFLASELRRKEMQGGRKSERSVSRCVSSLEENREVFLKRKKGEYELFQKRREKEWEEENMKEQARLETLSWKERLIVYMQGIHIEELKAVACELDLDTAPDMDSEQLIRVLTERNEEDVMTVVYQIGYVEEDNENKRKEDEREFRDEKGKAEWMFRKGELGIDGDRLYRTETSKWELEQQWKHRKQELRWLHRKSECEKLKWEFDPELRGEVMANGSSWYPVSVDEEVIIAYPLEFEGEGVSDRPMELEGDVAMARLEELKDDAGRGGSRESFEGTGVSVVEPRYGRGRSGSRESFERTEVNVVEDRCGRGRRGSCESFEGTTCGNLVEKLEVVKIGEKTDDIAEVVRNIEEKKTKKVSDKNVKLSRLSKSKGKVGIQDKGAESVEILKAFLKDVLRPEPAKDPDKVIPPKKCRVNRYRGMGAICWSVLIGMKLTRDHIKWIIICVLEENDNDNVCYVCSISV